MSAGIAIFVKTPGYSPVKSRLAAERGRAYAEAWYLRAAAAVASVARTTAAAGHVSVYWAVAEPAAIESGAWSGLPVLGQGAGGLGERMARVHATLVTAHSAGVLVGADTPQLSSELLQEAIAWLRQPGPRLILGPARDGGFWLFGANMAPPATLWEQVRYSAHETARDMRAAMASYGSWRILPELTDVDHANDLAAALQEFQGLPTLQREQQQLIDWMRTCEDLTA